MGVPGTLWDLILLEESSPKKEAKKEEKLAAKGEKQAASVGVGVKVCPEDRQSSPV